MTNNTVSSTARHDRLRRPPQPPAPLALVAVTMDTKRRPPLKKGFALGDWMRLLDGCPDIACREGAPLRDIGAAELALHNTKYDCWMAVRGTVYNVSAYLAYHPGGAGILVKAAGTDATKLYDEYHRWVNVENLVGACALGRYVGDVPETVVEGDGDEEAGDGAAEEKR